MLLQFDSTEEARSTTEGHPLGLAWVTMLPDMPPFWPELLECARPWVQPWAARAEAVAVAEAVAEAVVEMGARMGWPAAVRAERAEMRAVVLAEVLVLAFVPRSPSYVIYGATRTLDKNIGG